MKDREALEKLALKTISSELYYDLADSIEVVTDEELEAIIECNGNYKKELKIGTK